MHNGDLVVEVLDPSAEEFPFPPLVRFFGSGGARELFSEQCPSFLLAPAAPLYPAAAGDLTAARSRSTPPPGSAFTGSASTSTACSTKRAPLSTSIQRNTEVCVPFALSNRGYGFLWNMPGVGRVELGANRTRWVADGARQLDYWVTTAPTPAEIVSRIRPATGLPPNAARLGVGFWQCKLRYRTQDELLEVAREYKRRGLPISVIVVDYFHWTRQGEWQFDTAEWPDPQAMVDELRGLGVELDGLGLADGQPRQRELCRDGPARTARGQRTGPAPAPARSGTRATTARSSCAFTTRPTLRPAATSGTKSPRVTVVTGSGRSGWTPASRRCGRRTPRATCTTWAAGTEVQSVYPREHARGFAEGLWADGEKDVMLLCRSAWAGSQRYGAAVWSGDIESSFEALAAQIPAGLNIGISGYPVVDHRHRRVQRR